MKKLILSVASLAIVFASCSDDDDNTTSAVVEAAVISGGPYTFCVGDGEVDSIPEGDVVVEGGIGAESSFVVTDTEGNILGLPGVASGPDFDGAGVGMCYLYHINYEEGLTGLTGPDEGEPTGNINELEGDFELSNFLTVDRQDCMSVTVAAVLTGGPFEFSVCDGIDDDATEVAIESAGRGSLNTFVVTSETGVILGLPGTLEAVQTGPDFDGTGAGKCYIQHLNYEEGLEGLEANSNIADLLGDFAFSNQLEVNRISALNAGVISGGTENAYTFTVEDGIPDLAIDLSFDDSEAVGSESTWIITKGDGEILGLPGTIEMVRANDFDVVAAGTCLIWYMRYEGTLEGIGAMPGANALTDLTGCYAISNEITVNRN